MGHPIRWQKVCGVKFYRTGTVLIAPKGNLEFIVQKLRGGTWEASWRPNSGLRFPIGGDYFSTLRAALEYLRPRYEGGHARR